MAKFLRTGTEDGLHNHPKARVAKSVAATLGHSATTVRLIRLAKPANDNPTPLAVRLRWWAPLVLMAVAAVLWQLLR